jgi:2-polyprenyl-6-hydroxyphenyl methylase/3-demethylubiquinone-9 3-methyltransferase
MNELENDFKLSNKEYWDDVLASQKLPRVNTRKNYNYKVTMDFMHDSLKDPGYKTLFEVGCGSSGWLPYFAQRYGFVVSGIDYSEVGCKIARKNLEMLNIKNDGIICQDIFNPNCTNGQSYDVIFSYGVVEHFEKPAEIVKIFRSFTNPGGAIITLVPNLTGLNGWLTRYFMKDVYEMHRVINREQLQQYHTENGLTNVNTNYVGTFSLGVIPWPTSNRGVLKQGSVFRRFALKAIFGFNFVMTSILKILPDMPSRYLSPYIICIAKK